MALKFSFLLICTLWLTIAKASDYPCNVASIKIIDHGTVEVRFEEDASWYLTADHQTLTRDSKIVSIIWREDKEYLYLEADSLTMPASETLRLSAQHFSCHIRFKTAGDVTGIYVDQQSFGVAGNMKTDEVFYRLK